MAHTYAVQYDGKTFTRTTDQTYTHVVLAKRTTDGEWVAYGWRSSQVLATAAAKQAMGRGSYSDTSVLPVQVTSRTRQARGAQDAFL